MIYRNLKSFGFTDGGINMKQINKCDTAQCEPEKKCSDLKNVEINVVEVKQKIIQLRDEVSSLNRMLKYGDGVKPEEVMSNDECVKDVNRPTRLDVTHGHLRLSLSLLNDVRDTLKEIREQIEE